MNPISRLRTRARSEAGSSATGRPLSRYWPSVGESSSPRIDRSVDLPQPDGPAIDTYSALLIWRWMPESACVSTSSVKKTFVTPSSLISACPFSAMLFSCRPEACATVASAARRCCSAALDGCPLLLQSNPVVGVVGRHVGQDHLIADLESGQDLDGVHRTLSELDLDALGVHAISFDLEQADDALVLTERRPAHVGDVVEPFELDRAVDAQVGDGALRQVAGERDVDRARAVLH